MNAVEQLITALRCLPGVGPKSAQRMAYYLLKPKNRPQGHTLGKTLSHVLDHVRLCTRCRTFTEHDECTLCQNPRRDPQLLCIVENPIDIDLIEKTASFRGLYFVLHGHLSPLDGIHPEHLALEQLFQRLANETINELIIATNPTMEGEATAYYIAEQAQPFHIKTSRIAYGVPLGGELEFVDALTLCKALQGRLLMEQET